VSLDIHASVEHTEHRDVGLVHDQICDPVVAIRRFANISIVDRLISLSEPRMLAKQLSLGVNTPHDVQGRSRAIGGNVLVNSFKAPNGLESPRYFCHDSITSATSSSPRVRDDAASSSPRCTILANASSRKISS